jgi:hypothetical protein
VEGEPHTVPGDGLPDRVGDVGHPGHVRDVDEEGRARTERRPHGQAGDEEFCAHVGEEGRASFGVGDDGGQVLAVPPVGGLAAGQEGAHDGQAARFQCPAEGGGAAEGAQDRLHVPGREGQFDAGDSGLGQRVHHPLPETPGVPKGPVAHGVGGVEAPETRVVEGDDVGRETGCHSAPPRAL